MEQQKTLKSPKQPNKRFVLTRNNYYSNEADRRLMSVSQFKSFMSCELATMANLNGEYVRPHNDAFLAGNLLHSWVESPEAHQQFIEENKEHLMVKSGKDFYAWGKTVVNDVIPNLQADDKFMFIVNECEKEKIIRAKLFGIEWKCRIDLYKPDKNYFVDLKYIHDPYKSFFSKEKETFVNFIEYYKYDLQMVIYSELDKIKYKRKEPLNPYILAVSKEASPVKMLIGDLLFNKDEILKYVEENLERIIEVKNGKVEPKGCGKCPYCKSQSKLVAYNYLDIPID